MKQWLRRIAIGLGSVLALLVLMGAGYDAAARPEGRTTGS
jgi:hypothetical protein